MNGTIYFDNIESLAEFLKEFTGSTATFTVRQIGLQYVLEFNGGY